jgi:molybdate transport system permease protein
MDGAWPALWLSLQVATWATLACLVLGTGVGYALARWRFRGATCWTRCSRCPW